MDKISKEKRSEIMSKIRSRDTKIEMDVRKYLFQRGVRYRVNNNKIKGTPDISISKYKLAIFINGCFWHHHENCKYATIPKSNSEYWMNKFENNMKRDNETYKELENQGWHVRVIWECELKLDFQQACDDLYNWIDECKKTNL